MKEKNEKKKKKEIQFAVYTVICIRVVWKSHLSFDFSPYQYSETSLKSSSNSQSQQFVLLMRCSPVWLCYIIDWIIS